MRIRGPWTETAVFRHGPRAAAATLAVAAAAETPDLPHVRVDAEAGFVEVEAEVIGGDADWLELLLCTAGGREHESLLRTAAAPSHVNVCLLLTGLVPGRPAHRDAAGVFLDARGPEVRLTLVEPAGGDPVPAGAWIRDLDADATLADARWRFTGSRVVADAAGPAFLATVNGTLASLVSFGDDLLLLDLAGAEGLDAGNDGQRFVASDAVPPAGTPVVLRIQPMNGRPPFDTGPAAPDNPGGANETAPPPPQDADPS